MIHTYVPYAPKTQKLNLGWAYNNFMSLVEEDDWVLFLDHDATFTTRNWYPQIEDIITSNPEYGMFTCLTNRIGMECQKPEGIDENNHDIRYHREIGTHFQNEYYKEVVEYPLEWLSGVIILINKSTWKTTGGFENGFIGVDNCIHRACSKHGIKVGLMLGFYVYHWYRGDGDMDHVKESNILHQNPYFL